MDLTGCLRSLGADLDGPCTGLVLTGGQVADQAQETVACRDQLVQTGLTETKCV